MTQATGTLAGLNEFLSDTPTDINAIKLRVTVIAAGLGDNRSRGALPETTARVLSGRRETNGRAAVSLGGHGGAPGLAPRHAAVAAAQPAPDAGQGRRADPPAASDQGLGGQDGRASAAAQPGGPDPGGPGGSGPGGSGPGGSGLGGSGAVGPGAGQPESTDGIGLAEGDAAAGFPPGPDVPAAEPAHQPASGFPADPDDPAAEPAHQPVAVPGRLDPITAARVFDAASTRRRPLVFEEDDELDVPDFLK